MQGRSRLDRELLDAEMIAGHLVPAGSVFAFLAAHRTELFPGSFTADLFPSRTGRPSLPAGLVGAVLVLKELHDLSDPQTADALKSGIRWKVACGRSLTQMSFDPSTLVYWRRRIAASSRPDRVFDAVAAVIAETGILAGRRKRCVDSTVFDGAVAAQDTVTQLVAAMRKVARVVPGAAEVISRVCALDYSRPGKPGIDWDDPAAKENLVSTLVNDALAVLAELTADGAPQREAAGADALGLLALVAGQGRQSPMNRRSRARAITAALRAHSIGGSATLSDQLANARPGGRSARRVCVRGAHPFVASCLRLVVSLIWRRETVGGGVAAYGVAARACSGAGPARRRSAATERIGTRRLA